VYPRETPEEFEMTEHLLTGANDEKNVFTSSTVACTVSNIITDLMWSPQWFLNLTFSGATWKKHFFCELLTRRTRHIRDLL